MHPQLNRTIPERLLFFEKAHFSQLFYSNASIWQYKEGLVDKKHRRSSSAFVAVVLVIFTDLQNDSFNEWIMNDWLNESPIILAKIKSFWDLKSFIIYCARSFVCLKSQPFSLLLTHFCILFIITIIFYSSSRLTQLTEYYSYSTVSKNYRSNKNAI